MSDISIAAISHTSTVANYLFIPFWSKNGTPFKSDPAQRTQYERTRVGEKIPQPRVFFLLESESVLKMKSAKRLLIFIVILNIALVTTSTSRHKRQDVEGQNQLFLPFLGNVFFPAIEIGTFLDAIFNVNVIFGILYDILATVLGTRVERAATTQAPALVIQSTLRKLIT